MFAANSAPATMCLLSAIKFAGSKANHPEIPQKAVFSALEPRNNCEVYRLREGSE